MLGFLTGLTAIISILTPCVRSDDNRRKTHILRIEFQFSLPARGVIDSRCQLALQDIVSILAPCLGSDQRSPICHPSCHYFNSRSLFGARYHGIPAAGSPVDFNSCSFRGERYKAACLKMLILNFNSRPLRGERSYSLLCTC